MHANDPVNEKVPLGHKVQFSVFPRENLPASQAVQAVAPILELVWAPGEQSRH